MDDANEIRENLMAIPNEKIIAMIPARLGSQRLKQKNLQLIGGKPLIVHAVNRCHEAGVFDEIWVNTESDMIADYAIAAGAKYHKRPAELADNTATSEQFVQEFLLRHDCTAIIQVHSIAPLLASSEIRYFVKTFLESDYNTMLSCIEDQIEVAYRGGAVNFSFGEKTNSQDLEPVQRITWSITGWRPKAYLEAFAQGQTATYVRPIGLHTVSPISGHVIKTETDLKIAEALLGLI